MSNALPCPFCGHLPQVHERAGDERDAYTLTITYQCSGCGCKLSASGDTSKPGYADNSTVKQRALKAWNTRIHKD